VILTLYQHGCTGKTNRCPLDINLLVGWSAVWFSSIEV